MLVPTANIANKRGKTALVQENGQHQERRQHSPRLPDRISRRSTQFMQLNGPSSGRRFDQISEASSDGFPAVARFNQASRVGCQTGAQARIS